MSRLVPKRSDWIVLVLAVLLNAWPMLLMPLRGFGTVSFASGYRKAHIGMSWDEWRDLQRQYGVECVCDGTDCYLNDILRTYNISFRSTQGEGLKIWSKRVYLHFPFGREYR